MRYISFFSFFLLLFFIPVEIEEKQECPHCSYIEKYEGKFYLGDLQPKPYPHDKDSSLIIFPILENDDIPGHQYIQDIKFVYKDLHYCSDVAKVTIINKDTSFYKVSLKRMSCRINAVVRFDENEANMLATKPTQKIIIENLVTDNIYEYTLKDSLYFVNVYKKVNGVSLKER